MSELETIGKDYDKVKASLTSVAPFLSSLLRKARIILTKSVETAGVTPRGVMVLNPEFYMKLDYVDKTWLLGHERDIAVIHLSYISMKSFISLSEIRKDVGKEIQTFGTWP